jgi:signal transduction histidine kinase/ligand-binding sensor domain-containing protein
MFFVERISAYAQVLPFQNYTIRDGLLSNNITTLFQDSRGFLWIGTAEGISVFDGMTMTNYTSRDGLSNTFINTIIEDKFSGDILIGTNSGDINKFSNGIFSRIVYDSSANVKNIFLMFQDSKGTIWCGTNSGIFLYRNNSLSKFTSLLLPHDSSGNTTLIAESIDSTIWFNVNNTLYNFSLTTQSGNHFVFPKTDEVYFIALLCAKNGTTLVSTLDTMLYILGNDSIIAKKKNPFGISLFFTEATSQTIWSGTSTHLLRMQNDSTLSKPIISLTTSNGLPENLITYGIKDNEGNFWFGTYSKGIVRLTENGSSFFPMASDLNAINNSLLAVDTSEHCWFVNSQGLWEIWEDEFQRWHQKLHSKTTEQFTSSPRHLFYDKKNRLWISFSDESIKCYEIQEHSSLPSSLKVENWLTSSLLSSSMPIVCFIVDANDILWVSYNPFVAAYDISKKKMLYKFVNCDSATFISPRCLYYDTDGNMWIGDYATGLFEIQHFDSMNPKIFTYTNDDGLPDNAIRSIFEDKEGNIVVGTRYGGFALLSKKYGSEKRNVTQTLSQTTGLISNTIWCAALDSNGRIYLGTALGLETVEPQHFFSVENIRQFSGNAIYSLHISRRGKIYISTSEGITVFDESKIAINNIPPPIYITKFQVNEKQISGDEKKEFSYDENHCLFKFVGISLRDANNVSYQYRLVNADNEWRTTNQREVTFASLKHGTYTFEVLAVNADGIPSAQPATVSFTILPPFWLRSWFIVLAIFTVGSIIYTLSRYRLQKLLEMERLRTRIAADLHDELASNLSSIAIFGNIIEQKSKEQSNVLPQSFQLLERITRLSQESVKSIRDIIWAIDAKDETLGSLLIRLRDSLIVDCRAKNIQLNFDVETEHKFLSLNLPSEVRKNVYLLMKEVLTNAVKHSECSEIIVQYKFSDNNFYVNINDNGKGFDASKKYSGKGLHTMQSRAKELHGTLEILSEQGKGTETKIVVKL